MIYRISTKTQNITTLQRKKKEPLLKAPYFYLMKS